MQQAKPASKVLFVHYLYSEQIQKAAAALSQQGEADCFFEESPNLSLERVASLHPDIVLTHMVNTLDCNKQPQSPFFSEYHLGGIYIIKLAVQAQTSPFKLIVISTFDENGKFYSFRQEEFEWEAIVSNYIMPPKDHWDILLAVRQALYRRIEPLERN